MDTMECMMMGIMNRGCPRRIFDWKKAAEIIRDEKPSHVGAGIEGDWEYTGGTIYRDGEIVEDSYTYLSSTWAKPQICVDGDFRDCFLMEGETEWNKGTKWPDEAKAILDHDKFVKEEE